MNALDKQHELELLALRLKLTGPRIKKFALLSAGSVADKMHILPAARLLAGLGAELYATAGTSAFLQEQGVQNTHVQKIAEGGEPNIKPMLEQGRFDLVVNVLTGDQNYDEQSDARVIRSLAIEAGVPLITDATVAVAIIGRMAKDIRRERERIGTRQSMRNYFAELVFDRGGYADHHGHYDKAYLITPEVLELGQEHMEKKWLLYRRLKENYTLEDLIERITRCVEFRLSQGVYCMRTMVDADNLVQLKCIEAALEVKRRFEGRAVIEIGIQPLEGVLKPEHRPWVEKAFEMADFIGGLPSKDHPQPEKHLDFIMATAREQGKRLDVHVDQKGVPWEDETKLLALKTVEYGLQGRVAAIHAIISRKPSREQREIAKMLKDAGISVIVCPAAALSMEQLGMQVEMSNSIAPVPLLLGEGVNVAYGSDNTEDLFMPYSDGDPWYEVRLLMDACRIYKGPAIADIFCNRSLFATLETRAAA